MSIRTSRTLAILGVVLLAGCANDLESFTRQNVTPAERRFSIDYLKLLQAGGVDSAYSQLVPDLQTEEIRLQLKAMPQLLSGVPLDSLRLIGVNVHLGPNDERRVNLSYEVAAAGDYLVANVATRRHASGGVLVEGFSARPAAVSLFAMHDFTVQGRSWVHFMWLGLAAIMPVVCLGTAVIVARTRGMPKRWLWAAVALLAAPVFALNWTTGAWELRALAFVFLGAGAFRNAPTMPWIISFGMPLGAALALWRRSQWQHRSAERSSEPAV